MPQIIEFENPGNQAHVKNQGNEMLSHFPSVSVGETTHEPKLLGIHAVQDDKPDAVAYNPPPNAA